MYHSIPNLNERMLAVGATNAELSQKSGCCISTTAMMFAKEKPYRNKAFLSFVREHDCISCDWPAELGCIEAHHIKTGGMSTKCGDNLTVPLCNFYARDCHNKADKSPDSAEKFRPFAEKLWREWNERNIR